MDRAVTHPTREMKSQDKCPNIPLAIPLSVPVPSPSQAPRVSPADVRGEMESAQRQAPEEVPAVVKAPPRHTIVRSSLPPSLPTLESAKAPDRYIETI